MCTCTCAPGPRTAGAHLRCVMPLLVSMCVCGCLCFCVSLESELDPEISAGPNTHGPQEALEQIPTCLLRAPTAPLAALLLTPQLWLSRPGQKCVRRMGHEGGQLQPALIRGAPTLA